MSTHNTLIPAGASLEELKRLLAAQSGIRTATFPAPIQRQPGNVLPLDQLPAQLIPPVQPQPTVGLPLLPGARPAGPTPFSLDRTVREGANIPSLTDLFSSLNLPLFRSEEEIETPEPPPPVDNTERDQINALIKQLTRKQALPAAPDFSEIRDLLASSEPIREEQGSLLESILLGLAAGDTSTTGSLLLSAGKGSLQFGQRERKIDKALSKEKTAQKLQRARTEAQISQSEFQSKLALSRTQQKNQQQQAQIALAQFQAKRDTDLIFENIISGVNPALLQKIIQANPELNESIGALQGLGISDKDVSMAQKAQLVDLISREQPTLFQGIMQKTQQDFLLRALTGG